MLSFLFLVYISGAVFLNNHRKDNQEQMRPHNDFEYDPLLKFAGYILHGDDYTDREKLRAHQLALIDDLLTAFKRWGFIPEEMLIDTPLSRIAFRSMVEPLFSLVAPNLAEMFYVRHGRIERDITLYALANYLVKHGPTMENARRFRDGYKSEAGSELHLEIKPFLDRACCYIECELFGRRYGIDSSTLTQYIRNSQALRHQYYAIRYFKW